MSSLKILLVEDDTLNAMDLRETLEEAGHTITAIARTYKLALKAIQTQPPDLAIIDIHLDGSTADGITTARELTTRHRMPIIYLTANTEPTTFSLARETLPFAYLYKPFRPADLKAQIELAYQHFLATEADPSTSGLLFLPVDGGYEKIDTKDVLYIKADGSYTMIFLADERKYDKVRYHISMNLSNLAQHFPATNFFRLSRSYLVNLDYIRRLKDDCLHLTDGQTVLTIPANNRKELLRRLTIVRTK